MCLKAISQLLYGVITYETVSVTRDDARGIRRVSIAEGLVSGRDQVRLLPFTLRRAECREIKVPGIGELFGGCGWRVQRRH